MVGKIINFLYIIAFILFGNNFLPKANHENIESEFYDGSHFASLTTTFAISGNNNAKPV